MLEKEDEEQDARMQGSSPKSVESTAFNASMQEKSPLEEKAREASSEKAREASSEERTVEPDG
jgi:hypothetical protein